jgi:beta-mannanase
VDFIGLPIFGLQQFDQDHFGRDRSFSEVLQRKYDLVSAFHPPVVVVELGYEGDLNYVRDWAESVAIPHPAFPKLVGVVYFNDKEVYPWPDGYGYPDWRVVRGTGN